MRWPFRRRTAPAIVAPPAEPDTPVEPDRPLERAWASLPPLADFVPDLGPVSEPTFVEHLTTRQAPPEVLQPLAHGVHLDAPAGIATGIASVTAHAVREDLPELPLPRQRQDVEGVDELEQTWREAEPTVPAQRPAAAAPAAVTTTQSPTAPPTPAPPPRKLSAVPQRPAAPSPVMTLPEPRALVAMPPSVVPELPSPAASKDVPIEPPPPAADTETAPSVAPLTSAAPPPRTTTPMRTEPPKPAASAQPPDVPQGREMPELPPPRAAHLAVPSEVPAAAAEPVPAVEAAPPRIADRTSQTPAAARTEPDRAGEPTRQPDRSATDESSSSSPASTPLDDQPADTPRPATAPPSQPTMQPAFPPRSQSARPLVGHRTPAPVSRAPAAPSAAPARGPRPVKPVAARPEPAAAAVAEATAEVTAEVERATGHALGDVSIHRGPEAQRAAEREDAHAVTVGREVYLPDSHGPLDSGTARGLLAHELTHVAQHDQLGAHVPDQSTPAGRRLEAEARRAEERAGGRKSAAPASPAPRPVTERTAVTSPHRASEPAATTAPPEVMPVTRISRRQRPAAAYVPEQGIEPQGMQSPAMPAPTTPPPRPIASVAGPAAPSATPFAAGELSEVAAADGGTSTWEPRPQAAAQHKHPHHDLTTSSMTAPSSPAAPPAAPAVATTTSSDAVSRAPLWDSFASKVSSAFGLHTPEKQPERQQTQSCNCAQQPTRDVLTEQLYEQIRSRLRMELIVDRERAALLPDL